MKNTLYVPCIVNNKTINAVIDTAAQVTVMNYELFESLKPKPLLQKDIILKGAGKNNIINGKIAEQVKLRIGPTEQRWDVVVGEIADSLLLGLDFLRAHNCIINLENLIRQR